MKNLIIIALFFISLQGFSQQIYNLDKKKDSSSVTKTVDIAIYKGKELPVYKSARGKLFIYVTSKSGKEYRKYLN